MDSLIFAGLAVATATVIGLAVARFSLTVRAAVLFGAAALLALVSTGLAFAAALAVATATVVDALVSAGLVDSRSAARRAVTEGGAYVNNVRAEDPEATLDDAGLHGGLVVLRRGKKAVAGAEVSSA